MQAFVDKMWKWGSEVKPEKVIRKEERIKKQAKKILERLAMIKRVRRYNDMISLELDASKLYVLVDEYDEYILKGE